jgi:CubicO group peptidase (beta-lactamase class C family)
MFSRHSIVQIILTFFSVTLLGYNQNEPPGDLDAYIETGMNDWRIPGLAIAVVKDDETVYAEGFGVRKLDEPEQVDEHTLFGIASLTKAFTTAALAMLVDDGILDWDDPVIRYLPDFQLSDPWVTREITVRDLLIHRSGLGRMIGNRLQFMTNRSSDELTYRLRYLEPQASFRADYIYNNMMYMVAGRVIESVSGQMWHEFVSERIFTPLGMERSNFSIYDLEGEENAAWPHQYIEGDVSAIPRRDFDNIGPAGAVNASVYELTRWMRLHLGTPGEIDGETLISPAAMIELHRPQSVIPVQQPDKEFAAYGLGWGVRIYRDRIALRHAGASDGMNAFIVLVPGENLGVVILTNIFNDFTYALANRVIDSFIGLPGETDWHQKYLAEYRRQYEAVKERREEIHNARVPDTGPTLSPEDLSGRYSDRLYGELTVNARNNELFITFWDDDSLIADLEHWHYDTYRAVWRNPAQREKFVWFDRDRTGRVAVLNVEYNLRPDLLQVGAYPSGYTRVVRFIKEP